MSDFLVRPDIEAYAWGHTTPEPEWLYGVAEETHQQLGDRAGMLSGRLVGQLLKTLAWAAGTRRALELGTFTGYSALSVAQVLPSDGELVTCEFSEEHATIARRNFDASPHGALIEIRIGPALESLRTISGPFEFVFIDADKGNYTNYYEAVLPMLSARGIIAVDNTLWNGQVLDGADRSADTAAIRSFNDHVVHDARVECVQLTVRDGVTVIRKR